MNGYIALSFLIILSTVELTKAQSSARNVLENYQRNPTSVSKSDVEKAYNTICCGSNTDGLRRQERAGPLWEWFEKVKERFRWFFRG